MYPHVVVQNCFGLKSFHAPRGMVRVSEEMIPMQVRSRESRLMLTWFSEVKFYRIVKHSTGGVTHETMYFRFIRPDYDVLDFIHGFCYRP